MPSITILLFALFCLISHACGYTLQFLDIVIMLGTVGLMVVGQIYVHKHYREIAANNQKVLDLLNQQPPKAIELEDIL